MGLFTSIIDLIFPARCVNCQQVGSYFCEDCVNKVRWVETSICPYCKKGAIGGITHPYCLKRNGLDGLIAAFYFEGPIKKAVHLLKYRLITHLETELTAKMLLSFEKQQVQFTRGEIVPIPLFIRKQNDRGFNQVFILAEAIAGKWGLKLNKTSLVRRKSTSPQANLQLTDRLANLQDAFQVIDKNVLDKEIVLVDDVFTTGATVFSATEALKKAGAKKVWAVTLARSQKY